ncbi:MAG TPA: alanine racemase [Gemmatimonadaceae bacterium]|nr:alanine racemase [Gemmatimonadaceae bacterium]HRQ78059.1 alanine racemase [Gemmatimonadaceae bacterium]
MPTQSSLDALPRAWVEVDLAALVRNARAIADHAQSRLIPMIKADAYGLGAVPVARALEAVAPYAYGVSSIFEGEELRSAGIARPIIVFTPTLPSDLARLRAAGLTPALASVEGIRRWQELGGGDWQLSIETGMHRAGINWDRVGELADAIRAFPPASAFTHFHSAEMDDGSVEKQERRFRDVIASLPVTPALLHAENSAAAARRRPSAWGLIRPGAFLYGLGSGRGAALQPEPVVHIRAKILELREVASRETVSYNALWTAPEPRVIATVAVGYGDGYRRHLSNVGLGLLAGREVPAVGAVSMDMTMFDVTGLGARVGDVVTLLGRDGAQLLTIEDVAARGGFSPYELITGLRQRLQRIYSGAD